VGDVKNAGLETEVPLEIYKPYFQWAWHKAHLIVRTSSDPMKLAAALPNEVMALNPDQPVAKMRTMEQILGDAVAQPRLRTLLLGLFGALALVLAAVGIYGVMSYSVAQRTHEIGIRMALGAQRRDVLKLVVGQGMLLAVIGIAIGLAAALCLTRVMASLLFGVSATDAMTFIGLSLLLAGVALLACYLPSRNATRVDPMIALRDE
jgi:putative ABC transport system permease protein